MISNGTIYPNINRIKKVRRLQRHISRKYEMDKQEGESYRKTSNIIKSEGLLLKLHHRLKDINYRHQITTAIINRKLRLIVIEDFIRVQRDIQNLAESKKNLSL